MINLMATMTPDGKIDKYISKYPHNYVGISTSDIRDENILVDSIERRTFLDYCNSICFVEKKSNDWIKQSRLSLNERMNLNLTLFKIFEQDVSPLLENKLTHHFSDINEPQIRMLFPYVPHKHRKIYFDQDFKQIEMHRFDAVFENPSYRKLFHWTSINDMSRDILRISSKSNTDKMSKGFLKVIHDYKSDLRFESIVLKPIHEYNKSLSGNVLFPLMEQYELNRLLNIIEIYDFYEIKSALMHLHPHMWELYGDEFSTILQLMEINMGIQGTSDPIPKNHIKFGFGFHHLEDTMLLSYEFPSFMEAMKNYNLI